jgi:hypothetical protein
MRLIDPVVANVGHDRGHDGADRDGGDGEVPGAGRKPNGHSLKLVISPLASKLSQDVIVVAA